MANEEHAAILEQGVEAWNQWWQRNPNTRPNLIGADLNWASLPSANLRWADLEGARLYEADLTNADLTHADLAAADLTGADFTNADLTHADLGMACLFEACLVGATLKGADLELASLGGADLRRANLRTARLLEASLSGANLTEANLARANLTGADLREADLRRANLLAADLWGANLAGANLAGANLTGVLLVLAKLTKGADLTGCKVYGASVWNLELDQTTKQRDLRITEAGEPELTVDNIEVAQFIYLLLHNEKIQGAIDTIGKKGVLILGRFTQERKPVLDAIKERLRDFDHVPIVLDWSKPTSRDITETVQLLANLSRFVVADVTDAKSIPQELSHIVPFLPSVPVRPIILAGKYEYSMFEHWQGYNTMLPVFRYDDKDHLIDNIETAVLEPVKQWEAGYDKTKALEEQIARLRAENEKLKAAR